MHSAILWKRRRPSAALLLSAPLLLGACVTAGTHEEVVAQRDRLAERVQLLETSNESLDRERVALIESLEDLTQERSTLERDVAALRTESAELSESLSAREAELAKQNEEVARLRTTYTDLVADLEAEVSAGQIEIQQLRGGLRVNAAAEILFPSGSATLNDQGVEVLGRVARRLRDVDHQIEVEGHTDNVPIRGGLAERYPTNWELAAARAARVVRLFEDAGIAHERLVAVSYGQYRPIAENDSPKNRARNRRIEIRLVPPSKADVAAQDRAEKASRAPAGDAGEASGQP